MNLRNYFLLLIILGASGITGILLTERTSIEETIKSSNFLLEDYGYNRSFFLFDTGFTRFKVSLEISAVAETAVYIKIYDPSFEVLLSYVIYVSQGKVTKSFWRKASQLNIEAIVFGMSIECSLTIIGFKRFTGIVSGIVSMVYVLTALVTYPRKNKKSTIHM